MSNNFLASILHSLEHFCIFNSDCGTRNFRICWIIMHNTSMNRINTFRSYRSYQNCSCTVFSSITCTINSVLNGLTISCPLIVEQNNFSFNFISKAVQLRFIFYNNHLSSDVATNTAT